MNLHVTVFDTDKLEETGIAHQICKINEELAEFVKELETEKDEKRTFKKKLEYADFLTASFNLAVLLYKNPGECQQFLDLALIKNKANGYYD